MDFKRYYQNKSVADSYDSLRMKGIKGGITRCLERAAVDLLTGKAKKQKILEIGVGTGFISKILLKKGLFHGMDISQEMLKKAGEIGNIKLTKGDILNLKIKNKFDIIVTIRVISHLSKKDALRALLNINRALKKNGEAIFNLENKSVLRRILRKITNWGSTYTYQYSEREICEMAEKSGLKVDKILYIDHFFILPLHLLNKILFNKLNNFIFKLEIKLLKFPFTANNFFIKCKK